MLACLGNTWGGKDVDRICAYTTPKIVRFRHRELGCISWTLKALIVVYIFIWLIWYNGEHFAIFSVSGLNQLKFHHPTMNRCNPKKSDCHANFTSFDQLAYCSETGNVSGVKLPCTYIDGLGLPVPYRQGVILPTRVRKFSQEKQCAAQGNQTGCLRVWDYLDADGNKQPTDTKGQSVEHQYVADLERFTVMIDHSYASEELGVGHDDFKMQGYYMDCDHEGRHHLKKVNCVRKPIICAHRKCKPWMITQGDAASTANLLASEDDEEAEFDGFSGDDDDEYLGDVGSGLQDVSPQKPQETALNGGASHLRQRHHRHRHPHHVIDEIRYPSVAMVQVQEDPFSAPVFSRGHGDVLTIGTMLRLAGVNLDDDHFGKPFRYRGCVIVISITYSNKKPWQLLQTISPPEYTIEVFRRPSFDYQLDQPILGNDAANPGSNERRTYMSYHGIFVVVEQRGELQSFSVKHLFVILAGAISLLKGASLLTDFAACNLIRDKEEVKSLKYEDSRDFFPDRG